MKNCSSITKNSNVYDEKYMKIKFDSDDLPVNVNIKVDVYNVTIVVRIIFMKITNIIHHFS